MKRRLTEPFGKAGLIVGILALVFAMLGGAYAATGGSGGGKATASAKAKQGKQGKPGKPGPAGPQGPAGAKGDTGPAGAKGDTGAKGDQGIQGIQGVPGPKGANGKDGVIHPGETLPTGASETGTWGFKGTPENTYRCISVPGTGEYEDSACRTFAATPGTGNFEREKLYQGRAKTIIPISFPIPLAAAIAEGNVQIFEGETAPAGCKLTGSFLEAEPGHLCVQLVTALSESVTAAELTAFNVEAPGLEGGAGRTGTALYFESKEAQSAAGLWAVTAK